MPRANSRTEPPVPQTLYNPTPRFMGRDSDGQPRVVPVGKLTVGKEVSADDARFLIRQGLARDGAGVNVTPKPAKLEA